MNAPTVAPARLAAMPDPRLAAPPALRPLYAVSAALAPLYEQITDCPNCVLARNRSRTVPGSGPAPCDLMFIGEAPGEREDELGLPFVGRSGQFLDELLAAIDRARPSACAAYLERQIAAVNPRVIATLGRYSMARWFPGERISQIHGRAHDFDGRTVIPMYHPAAALRDGSLRAVMRTDFAQIPALLGGAR